MYKIVACALVACVSAQTEFTKVDTQSVDVYKLKDNVLESSEAAGSLTVRVDALTETTAMTAVGVKLAATTMSRIDKVMDQIKKVKAEVVSAVIAKDAEQAKILNYTSWIQTHEELMAQEDAFVNEAKANGQAFRDELLGDVEAANELVEGLEDQVDAALVDLEAKVVEGVKQAESYAGWQDSDEQIYQVTGFYPDEISKYWDGKIVTSSSEVSEVSGRKFYKVKFNIKQQGYWSHNSDEMFAACRGLSTYLRRQDGIERDLRPPCNHYGHWRRGGLGQCIFIMRSYFSHCGGGGYWRETWTCGGTPESWLHNTVMYEDLHHNWDRHLVHYRENSHGWQDAMRTSQYQYTLCTGGNQNYRL